MALLGLANSTLVFIIAAVVVTVSIIALTLLERRLSLKLTSKKQKENDFYYTRLSALENIRGDSREQLFSLDNLAREFFREAYHIRSDMQYDEMIIVMKKKNKKKAAEFVTQLQETMYGGVNLDEKGVSELSGKLESLINEYHIIKSLTHKKKFKEKPSWVTKLLSRNRTEQASQTPRERKPKIVAQKQLERTGETKPLSLGTRFTSFKESLLPKPIHHKQKNKTPESFVLSFVPLHKEKISSRRKKHPEEESGIYKLINGLDNLDRLKQKISDKRKHLSIKNERDELGLI